MDPFERFVRRELDIQNTKGIDITRTVKIFDDLFRYLDSALGKSHFLYFKRNPYNEKVFEDIGRLGGLHRLPRHWEAFTALDGTGVIAFSRFHMLLTSGLPHYKDLFIKELEVYRV